MYRPQPVDVEDVSLSEEILQLTEELASSVHDIWAEGRISEGWTCGPVKDPVKKTTPLLVPYDQLPESEKDYDRNTALYALRFVIKKGYRIVKEGENG